MRRLALMVLALWSCTSTGQDGELYRRFLSLVGTIDTNHLAPLEITSPLLTDTNNAAPKLTNPVVNLSEVCSNGIIAGIRVGMTMEDVVASWGKPRRFYSRCMGGPCFFYEDADVIFDPSSNSVMRVFLRVNKLPRLQGGLSASSSAGQFEAILGNPVARTYQTNLEILILTYKAPRSTLMLEFSEGSLFSIHVDRPAGKTEGRGVREWKLLN